MLFEGSHVVRATPKAVREERTRDCACGLPADYSIADVGFCVVCTEREAPGTIPPLPANVEIRWQLDPIGDERLWADKEANLKSHGHCHTIYRIIPDTLESSQGWMRGPSFNDGPHHGYTQAGILLQIRQMLTEPWWKDRTIDVIIISNYGYGLYSKPK